MLTLIMHKSCPGELGAGVESTYNGCRNTIALISWWLSDFPYIGCYLS